MVGLVGSVVCRKDWGGREIGAKVEGHRSMLEVEGNLNGDIESRASKSGLCSAYLARGAGNPSGCHIKIRHFTRRSLVHAVAGG